MTATCNDCAQKRAYVRGVCKGCYSARRRAGTLDQLPPPRRQAGICDRGHELTGDNLYMRPDGTARVCRTCSRDRQRAAKATTTPPKPRAPRPKTAAKAKTAPTSSLPPGWDRVTPPKVHAKPGQAGSGITKILEVPLVILSPEAKRQQDALRRQLARRLVARGADDLLAMLGLEAA